MFSSGPKSRTTAAWLAIFLGWAGIHKFYLGYWNVGFVHVALTGVGLMVFSASFAAPGDDRVSYIAIAAGVAILLGYFYVRRFQLGHPMSRILNPARVLLWPWLLFRLPFLLFRTGWRIMMEEERERQRQWRGGGGFYVGGRRYRYVGGGGGAGRYSGGGPYYVDDGGGAGCPVGSAIFVMGLMLSAALVGGIILLYGFIAGLIAYLAVAAPVASVAIGVIEGVRYLIKSDSQFQAEYVAGQRLWF